ncbi:MAG: c-type cytochrome [Proteobacteria bacterium]|nr:c-type cytochrome [Pseudomonadota bacterium]
MEKLKRWALRGLAGLVLLVVGLAVAVFMLSEGVLNQRFEPLERAFTVPDDAKSIAAGGRLALVVGCYNGCHGKGAGGSDFFGLAAPNLTKLVYEYSERELEAAIRQGIRPDGAGLIAMPSDSFSHMSDEDLGRIIAFLRSLPRSENDPGRRRFSAMNRLFLIYLKYWQGVEVLQPTLTSKASPPASAPSEQQAFGRYLASFVCSECHGGDLFGSSDFPDLIVASAYTLDEFRHLMATGETFDDRELTLMALVSEKRFSHFNEAEVEALYAFLTSEEFTGAVRQ